MFYLPLKTYSLGERMDGVCGICDATGRKIVEMMKQDDAEQLIKLANRDVMPSREREDALRPA